MWIQCSIMCNLKWCCTCCQLDIAGRVRSVHSGNEIVRVMVKMYAVNHKKV